jgi:DNA-binding transcriptional MerR regulator
MQTLIGTKEVAERLNVTIVTVWRWSKSGVLKPTIKVGKQSLFDPAYIERVREERQAEQSLPAVHAQE